MGIAECWCGFTSISERLSTCFGLLLTERQKQETKHSFFVSFIRPSVCTCLKLPSGQRHSWIVPVWIGWMHNETEQLCTTYHSCPWFFNILLGDDLGVSGNTPPKINSQLMLFYPHKFSPISCCSSMSAMTKRVCWLDTVESIQRFFSWCWCIHHTHLRSHLTSPFELQGSPWPVFFVLYEMLVWSTMLIFKNLSLQYWCDFVMICGWSFGFRTQEWLEPYMLYLGTTNFWKFQPTSCNRKVHQVGPYVKGMKSDSSFCKAFVLGLRQWEFVSASSTTKGLHDYTPPLPATASFAHFL